MKKTLIFFGIDILAAALILLTVWIINYKIPQKGIQALPLHKIADMQQNVNIGSSASGDSLQKTEMKTAKEDWHQKFADKFTDKVVATDTSYTSPDLSVKLTFNHYNTGKSDYSDAGKNGKYGTAVSYVLADIYIGCLLLVDGRQLSTRGMFPSEMAQLFEKLGCKSAYNLDGGHCPFMTYKDQVVNHPYKPEHQVSDGIFITEGTA